MNSVFHWLFNGHAALRLEDYFVVLLFALLGSFTCAFAVNPKITLPSRSKSAIDLGFLRFILVGTAAGLAVGYPPPVPFAVGLVSPIVLPIVLHRLLPAIVRAIQPMLIALVGGALEQIGNKKDS